MAAPPLTLPDEMRSALSEVARAQDRSELEVLLEALRSYLGRTAAPRQLPTSRPTVPLTGDGYGDPTAAERVDELLKGMGRHDC
jgi:hypothetical protein